MDKQKKVRHHRIHLYPYDFFTAPLWSLPVIGPSPSPMTWYSRTRRVCLRKIHLVPML